MKPLILFTVFCCIAPRTFCQDLLLMKDGKKIYCKIVRMDSEKITIVRKDDSTKQESIVNRADVSKIKYVGVKKEKSKPKKINEVEKPKNPGTDPVTNPVTKGDTASVKNSVDPVKENKKQEEFPPGSVYPAFMLGAATGINSYSGLLGIAVKLNFFDKVALEGEFGIGSWGRKYSAGIIYQKNIKSMYFGLGYSSLPGVSGLKLKLELENKSTQEVPVDFLKTSTVNLKMGKNWKVGRKHLFYLEYGFAVPLQQHPWAIKDGSTLSKASVAELNLLQPGGLLFGLGFLFGIGK